jgi:alpha-methylacyl-CoA racemase
MSVGPLAGVRVVELAGIGPGPFAGMLLADMGAELIRVKRPGHASLFGDDEHAVVNRGRGSVEVDLKQDHGRELVLELIDRADGLIEGFRPGVMERLGLGPELVLGRNERLVYGRVTGYGQDGPMSSIAGHDINYISLAGVLGACARTGERPMFPLNLLGDYGAGGMLLAFGVVCALLEARASGHGQVVDASMVDGAALLSSAIHGLRAAGEWSDRPGENVLDSGAHFYEVYETADGGYVAVGAIESRFYAELLRLLGIPCEDAPQWDRARWPELKERFAAVFRTRTRAQWAAVFDGSDACATAVLALGEATEHPHNRARGTFVQHRGVLQPGPAPRFSRTPGAIDDVLPIENVLRDWGVLQSSGTSGGGGAVRQVGKHTLYSYYTA